MTVAAVRATPRFYLDRFWTDALDRFAAAAEHRHEAEHGHEAERPHEEDR